MFGLRLVGGGPEGKEGGGARQGAKISKIGAQIEGNKVFFEETQSGSSRDQSGPSRDPIGHQFFAFLGTAFGQSGSSRNPVGIQSGTNFQIFGTTFGPVGKEPKSPKNANTAKMLFFMNLAASRHWCPTGSRLAKSGAQKCKNWCPTGSRRDPDEIPTGYIDRQEPTPAPIFPFPDPPLPLFSFPRTSRAPIPPSLLHQNGKSSLKPNGGSTRYNLYMLY